MAAFNFALFGATSKHSNKVEESLNLQKYKNKTVYLIIEGTTTNNKAILKFPKAFNLKLFVEINKSQFKFKAVNIKSHPTYLTVSPIPQSFHSFVYKNLSSICFNVSYKLKLFDDLGTSFTEDDVREKMSNFGRLKLISEDFDVDTKSRFVKSYNRVKR
ncbi:unnamed protein product [Ambrosiozyma monospora]|uniref:Unnamed protein product n=1 Tax=Ambrosiozyma monospora TaxID=43982 RepID=A0ACB5TD30_AMBMO|nr:unnamed protein product [Ambrosiozyma monospora]